MKHTGIRGRATVAVMALTSMPGAMDAMAQGSSIAGVACQVSFVEGNAENGKPNYVATANRAEFAFLAPMDARGDAVSL